MMQDRLLPLDISAYFLEDVQLPQPTRPTFLRGSHPPTSHRFRNHRNLNRQLSLRSRDAEWGQSHLARCRTNFDRLACENRVLVWPTAMFA